MNHPLASSPESLSPSHEKKDWVHFEDETPANQESQSAASQNQDNGAVIDATHVEVTIDKRPDSSIKSNTLGLNSRMVSLSETSTPTTDSLQNRTHGELPMQTISLNDTVHYREVQHNGHQPATSYKNGTLLTTVMPEQTRCAWVTTPTFVPELVPQELFASNLTLTVEDYVMAMEFLVNDCRFNCYTVCYRRLIFLWILLGFCILIALLFSGLRDLSLFAAGIIWLIVNAIGIFVCLYIKKRINRDMESAISAVNRILIRQNIMMCMEDRGKLSCHKIALPFVYFDCGECLIRIGELIEDEERKARLAQGLPLASDDNSQTLSSRLVKTQERAEKLVLIYSHLYVKELVRHRLNYPKEPPTTTNDEEINFTSFPPQHCPTALCVCQYIELRHFQAKPRKWYQIFI